MSESGRTTAGKAGTGIAERRTDETAVSLAEKCTGGRASSTPEKRTGEERANLAEKRAGEARLVSEMVTLYCRGHHHAGAAPCPECQQLIDYCTSRIARCPREAEKTFCSACPRPCYRPEQRERIREVMRWSGPRMLLVHPTVVVRHLVASPPWQRAARARG